MRKSLTIRAAVNIDGSKAVIEVRESVPVPEIADTSTPCNIVAAEDGIITKIQLFRGQEEIKTGSAVLKGDLLISGVKTNLDKSETLVCADGKIFAKTEVQKWLNEHPLPHELLHVLTYAIHRIFLL